MPVFASIGAAVFGAGTFLAGLTAAGLQLAAGIAFSAIGKAMQGEPQPAKFGVQGTLQGGDDVPRSINFGWNCTAGSLVYHNTWGAGGVMSTRVIAMGDAPVRELVGVEVSGVGDTLGGPVHAQYGSPVLGFRKGGVDHLWVKFYDGTQTAADPYLVSQVSSADRPYTSNRVGRGVPYVIVTARAPERADGEEKPLFQGLPSYKFITNGVRLYDPSKDTTVGGSGTQRWDNSSTWGGDGDFLPPVQIYNLLRGIRVEGQWLYGMQATHPARVDNATFIAAINRARAIVPGTAEPTFRAGGEVQVGAPVHLSIEALVTACNGRLVEVGGTYKLYVGEPGAPVMAFTDGDILSTEEQTFSPFLSLADTVNGVSASYPNPGEGWNVKTAPTLLRPDLEVLDGNRRLLASVSLDMVPYAGQVQRLMKWALGEALRARRHTFVLGSEFRVIEPGDIVRWSSVRNGYVDKLFRVDGVIYKANLDVIVDLTEVDPSDYDWNQSTDYRPVVDGPLQLVGPRPMPMQGWQVFPAILSDEQGRPRKPSIEVWTASGLSGVDGVRVQVRVADEDRLEFDSPPLPYGDPWKWILQGQFSANTDYEVRGIFVGPPNAQWSGWLPVTTPDVKLTSLDIELDDIANDIAEQVSGLEDWTRHNTRETIEEKRKAILLNVAGAVGDYNDRQIIRREASSQSLANKASWTEDILVATGPGSAIVLRIEELRTEVFDPVLGLPATATAVNLLSTEVHHPVTGLEAIGNSILSLTSSVPGASADGVIRMYTEAAPAGALARAVISVAATASAAPSLAAMYLDAMSDGKSRILMVADQISFTNGTALENPFVFEGGVLTMRATRVQTITAGILQSPDGKFVVNLGAKRISIST